MALPGVKNGAAAFLLQLRRVTVDYCGYGGSSKHVRAFISEDLPAFAKENPSVEVVVRERRGRHPCLRGDYLNGREKVIGVKNLERPELLARLQLLRGTTGAKITKLRAPSFTDTPSIQGFWNPFEQYPGLRKNPPAPRA